jgi:hypothetical protein
MSRKKNPTEQPERPKLRVRNIDPAKRTTKTPADKAGPALTPFSADREADYDAKHNPEQRRKQLPRAADYEEKRKEEIKARQIRFLDTLEACMGIVSNACRQTGEHRQTVDQWRAKDDWFAAEYRNRIDEMVVDYLESKMLKLVKEDNVSMIQFALRTKGRNRGYGDQVALTGAGGGNIGIDMTLTLPMLKEELPREALDDIIKKIANRSERRLRSQTKEKAALNAPTGQS